MKTIKYDPTDYEVISTIEYGEDLFHKVKFKSGYYGIVYVTTDKNTRYYDVIFIGTDKGSDVYVDVFLEFARSQTEVINKIHEKVDKVSLLVQLDNERSEIFEEVVSKNEANDLLERLRITNEIHELTHNPHDDVRFLEFMLIGFILLNIACIIWNLKGGI